MENRLNPRVDRYRHSWRLRIPPDPGETRRIERWLATARVFLAISTLVAIRMDPTELGSSWAAYGLFVLTECTAWIAILVFAYSRGGAAVASFVAVAQLVPAAVLAR